MDEHDVSVGVAFSHLCHMISTFQLTLTPIDHICGEKVLSIASHLDGILSHILYPQCTSVFVCVCVCVYTKCSNLVQVGQREMVLEAFTSICCVACTNTYIYTQTHHDGLSASKACPLSFKRYTLWPQNHSALGFLHGICLPAPGAKAGGRGRGLGPR